jgi:hypothetical protein
MVQLLIPLTKRSQILNQFVGEGGFEIRIGLELSHFLKPNVVSDHRNAPVNALGYLRVMFAVDDIDETLERLGKRGAQLVGEIVQYQDS